MLIPRFTIRWLLGLTAVCSVFFLVLASALRGQLWAMALSIAITSAVVAFLCYAALFGVAYALAALFGAVRSQPRGGSPFAAGVPPPQLIPPEESE
jgi:hypothetical protein